MTRRQQVPWMAHVKVGDVLRDPGGNLRVVRRLSRFDDGDVRALSFTIMRCSWTGRCYTVKNFTDLLKWEFVLKRDLPSTALDRKIARELRNSRRFKQTLSCCDVRGVA